MKSVMKTVVCVVTVMVMLTLAAVPASADYIVTGGTLIGLDGDTVTDFYGLGFGADTTLPATRIHVLLDMGSTKSVDTILWTNYTGAITAHNIYNADIRIAPDESDPLNLTSYTNLVLAGGVVLPKYDTGISTPRTLPLGTTVTCWYILIDIIGTAYGTVAEGDWHSNHSLGGDVDVVPEPASMLLLLCGLPLLRRRKNRC
jgi:hypothetical protein